MNQITTQLVSGLAPATFFSILSDVMPFIILMVPIAFAFTIIRKAVKGAAKGKARM